MTRVLLAFVFLIPFSAARAADSDTSKNSNFDDMVDFFRQNVQGTSLEMKAEGPSFDEKFQVTFKRMMTFDKLHVQKDGHSFYIDAVANVEKTFTPVLAEGEEAKADAKPYVEKNTIKKRLELSERTSGGAPRAVGMLRTLTIDGEKVYGEGAVVLGEYDEDKDQVTLTDSEMGYEDDTKDGVNFLPISRGSTSVFSVKDDSLTISTTLQTYLVNVDTFDKELKATHEIKTTQIPGLPQLFTK